MARMRGAWGALLLAGAAYAWRNRDRLSQQLGSLRRQASPDTPRTSRSYELPDYSATEQRDFDTTTEPVARERGGFGGQSF